MDNTLLLVLVFLTELLLLWRVWHLEKRLAKKGSSLFADEEDLSDDALYKEAVALLAETKRISTAYLQRKLKIGYARAARLLDLLEERGLVSPGRLCL